MDGLERVLKFLHILTEKDIGFNLSQQASDELMVSFSLVNHRIEATFDVDMMSYCVFKGSESVKTDEAGLLALIEAMSK